MQHCTIIIDIAVVLHTKVITEGSATPFHFCEVLTVKQLATLNLVEAKTNSLRVMTIWRYHCGQKVEQREFIWSKDVITYDLPGLPCTFHITTRLQNHNPQITMPSVAVPF